LWDEQEYEYVTENETGELPVAESSKRAASRKNKKSRKIPKLQCSNCMDMVVLSYLFSTACDHEYCGDCLLGLFNSSLVDESLFPPRCCKNVFDPDDEVARFLSPEIIAKYKEKKIEVETIDRTYCSDPRCSAFLRPEDITGDRGTCPTCSKVTCTMCKAPSHEGDCRADEGF
jgi:hypothetical protein